MASAAAATANDSVRTRINTGAAAGGRPDLPRSPPGTLAASRNVRQARL